MAAILTGVANAIEDGFDQEAFGMLYLAGVTPFFLGQILLAILLGLGDRRAFALVPMFTFLGSFAVDQVASSSSALRGPSSASWSWPVASPGVALLGTTPWAGTGTAPGLFSRGNTLSEREATDAGHD
jgi:hypothetical protein